MQYKVLLFLRPGQEEKVKNHITHDKLQEWRGDFLFPLLLLMQFICLFRSLQCVLFSTLLSFLFQFQSPGSHSLHHCTLSDPHTKMKVKCPMMTRRDSLVCLSSSLPDKSLLQLSKNISRSGQFSSLDEHSLTFFLCASDFLSKRSKSVENERDSNLFSQSVSQFLCFKSKQRGSREREIGRRRFRVMAFLPSFFSSLFLFFLLTDSLVTLFFFGKESKVSRKRKIQSQKRHLPPGNRNKWPKEDEEEMKRRWKEGTTK